MRATAVPMARQAKSSGGDDHITRAFRFSDLSTYTPKKQFIIRLLDLLFTALIRIIGSTTRFSVEGWEHWEEATRNGRLPIYSFWHNRIVLSTYFWRKRDIIVMTSQSFDGEYIARFIQRFGFGTARGSSTRGGVGALVEMIRFMRAGYATAFTIDGPRGPRYVAKMGAILLAKKTGQPILPFTIHSRRFITIQSWDGFRIPLPFSRAHVRLAEPIFVPDDAGDAELEAKRNELQRALDQIDETPEVRDGVACRND